MSNAGDMVQLDDQDLRFIDAAIAVLDALNSDNRQEPVTK